METPIAGMQHWTEVNNASDLFCPTLYDTIEMLIGRASNNGSCFVLLDLMSVHIKYSYMQDVHANELMVSLVRLIAQSTVLVTIAA